MPNKPTSQFTAITTLDSADRVVAYEASESELRTVTGTVILAWLGASLDMSTIASGGALSVAYGGSGRATGTTAYSLVATGTTATGAQQTLANGATTEVLVGGGASALPVWTTATGTGAPVRATSPTLVTPVLGTPSSGTLTSCTGLPISTGVSGLGTGVATFLATPSSANLKTAVTDETGSGALVFATSPTLVTPVLGVASATSLACPTFTTSSGAMAFTPASGSNFNVEIGSGGALQVTGTNSTTGLTIQELATSGARNTYLDFVNTNSGGGDPCGKVRFYSTTSDLVAQIEVTTGVTGASAYMAFHTDNGTSLAEKMRISELGNVGIGVTSFGTSAVSVIGIGNGTAPSSSPANMVQLYAEDVSSSSELKVRDEGGTVTVLSPHPWDAPDALEYLGHGLDEYSASKNMYRGECYWFNRSKFYFDDTATKADCRMIETFDAYNTRRGLSEGDKGFLVQEDWAANQASSEAARQAEIADATTHNDAIPTLKQRRTEWKAAKKAALASKNHVAVPDEVVVPEPREIPIPYQPKKKPSWLDR